MKKVFFNLYYCYSDQPRDFSISKKKKILFIHVTEFPTSVLEIVTKSFPRVFLQIHPLLRDMNAILVLLMNFMYGSTEVKVALTKAGLADVLHKLWAWIALNKTVSTTALKLLATYTTKCTTGIVKIEIYTYC